MCGLVHSVSQKAECSESMYKVGHIYCLACLCCLERTPKTWLYKGLGPLKAGPPLAWPPIEPQGGGAKPPIGGETKGQLHGGHVRFRRWQRRPISEAQFHLVTGWRMCLPFKTCSQVIKNGTSGFCAPPKDWSARAQTGGPPS